MRKYHIFWILILLVNLTTIQLSAQVKKDDINGFSTLLISPAPRHAAMGEGIGSTSSDLFSLYSNPAGILDIDYFAVGAAHNQWIADFRSEFVGLVYHPGKMAIGFSINYGTVGEMERRTGPTDQPEGYFDLNDLAVAATVAHAPSRNFKLGLTSKLLYEKIDVYSSTGLAFDFGAQYNCRNRLTLGASFCNLGTQMKLNQEKYDLPQLVRAGVSYGLKDFLITGEIFYPFDDDPHFHLGGEYALRQMVFLRAGYQTGYDEKNVGFGLGFREKGFCIDYAFVPFKSDLGDSHRISLTYSLSKEE